MWCPLDRKRSFPDDDVCVECDEAPGCDKTFDDTRSASREKWLCAYLATLRLDAAPLAIGYAFYDTSSDGVLDVIRNDEFHAAFVEVTMDLTAACRDQE